MRLYTKTGDKGQTSLYGGERRSKSDRRITAYGEVDELQAVLGLARCVCDDPDLDQVLLQLQNTGFVLSSQLARPQPGNPSLTKADISWLEQQIDRLDAEAPPLRSFVVPGGTQLAACLHLARTVCRRAERAIVALAAEEKIDEITIQYINRLSDLLFVMARVVNYRNNTEEITWKN